jgi:hypothetical protein
MTGSPDEERALDMVRQAFAAEQEVPAPVVAAAMAALSWRQVEDELELLFDSEAEAATAGLRAPGPARQVVFRGGGLTVECELTGDALVGQVLPPAVDQVEVQQPSTATTEMAAVDARGWFTVTPLPAGPWSLRLRRAGRPDLVTPWLLP